MHNLYLLLVLAANAFAQDNGRAVIRTSGQYDRDGSILYNVYIASKEEDVEELTISAALPPGTRFLEAVHKPQDAIYDGVQHDQVFWRVAKLERDTLMGPFVFRVALDGSIDSVPATILAAAAYQRPVPQLIESPAPEGKLIPFADRGSLTVDGRGTIDASGQNAPVPIGETGVILFIPEGALSQRITLSVTRLNVAENKLPGTDPATWWCGLYQLSSEPQVQFSKGVSVAFPTRRAVTPGNTVSLFTTSDLETWTKATSAGPSIASKSSERAIGFGGGGFGQFGGGCGFQQFGGFTTCGFGGGFGFGGFGAFGYVEQDNLRSKTTTTAQGTPPASLVTSPPNIGAVLIGLARP